MAFKIEKATNCDSHKVNLEVNNVKLKNVTKYGKWKGRIMKMAGYAKQVTYKVEGKTHTLFINRKSLFLHMAESYLADPETFGNKIQFSDTKKKAECVRSMTKLIEEKSKEKDSTLKSKVITPDDISNFYQNKMAACVDSALFGRNMDTDIPISSHW